MYSIQLTDEAYHTYETRVQGVGLNVVEYLNLGGAASVEADGFIVTPELRARMQQGLQQAEKGQVMSVAESKSRLDKFKAEWREQNSL